MNSTQYLLRFDDICPTMNWKVWEEIERQLVQRRLNPMLAVVPDNRDPTLQADAPAGDFWERVRGWQDRGWVIALHGYQHRYVSQNAGMVAVRKKSEFAGLPMHEQWEKLRRGVELLHHEGIRPRVWIAPGNTFDETTVGLLSKLGIQLISDGHVRFPFVCSNGMTWIPQQLFGFRPAPPGVWTVCYHHNNWDQSEMREFVRSLDEYGERIAALDDVVDGRFVAKRPATEWLCYQPTLSRFLIRVELKLWSWLKTGAGKKARMKMKPAGVSS